MTQLFQLRQHLHSLSVLRFYFRTSTVISALFSWTSFNYTESPLCIIFCDYFILHFITMIIISEITKLFCYKLKILALFNVIIFSMSLSPSYTAHQTIFCLINILFAIYTIWSFCKSIKFKRFLNIFYLGFEHCILKVPRVYRKSIYGSVLRLYIELINAFILQNIR